MPKLLHPPPSNYAGERNVFDILFALFNGTFFGVNPIVTTASLHDNFFIRVFRQMMQSKFVGQT